MKLLNGAMGLVELDKIVKYLINPEHPERAGKARFFSSLGFEPEEWQVLADALLGVAIEGDVSKIVESSHGSKYIVDGVLRGPNGRMAMVRTVWIKEPGNERPTLVTAYPREA